MVIAGVIAEYNPFHTGHRYHIEETRKKTGADYIIAVMSGDYVQRGEPAVADKYLRTKMALEGGVDAVLEIPTAYATASAEYFATAGVKLLSKLNCVDYLSFGSEWADTDDFLPYVKLFTNEPEEYKERFRKCLKSGENYPTARMHASREYFKANGIMIKNERDLLNEPNHILGIEYMKYLERIHSDIKPITIERKGARYHDRELGEAFSSASAIRTRIAQNLTTKKESDFWDDTLYDGIRKAVCCECEELVRRFKENNYTAWEDLMPYLDYSFLLKSKVLGKYFGVDLDLARRIQKFYEPGICYEDMMELFHSKALTDTALRRALLHVVLHMKEYPFFETAASIPVPYARVLGFRKESASVLKVMRENAEIDILQKPAEGKRIYTHNSPAALLYDLDIRSADFYEQISARKCGRRPKSEFVREQVMV